LSSLKSRLERDIKAANMMTLDGLSRVGVFVDSALNARQLIPDSFI